MAANPPSDSAAPTSAAQRVPLRTVLLKTAYLAGIMFAALATAAITITLLQHFGFGRSHFAVIPVAGGFGAWARQIYLSEGGKLAALVLFGGIFALILLAMAVSSLF